MIAGRIVLGFVVWVAVRLLALTVSCYCVGTSGDRLGGCSGNTYSSDRQKWGSGEQALNEGLKDMLPLGCDF